MNKNQDKFVSNFYRKSSIYFWVVLKSVYVTWDHIRKKDINIPDVLGIRSDDALKNLNLAWIIQSLN